MSTSINQFGNYRLGHLIDAVDDQQTFYGVHRQLKRETEVTLTKSSSSITAQAAERYVAIARRIQPIVHPSLPKVYNAGLADGTAFITTERVVGEPLGSREKLSADVGTAYQQTAQAMICIQLLFERGLTLHRFEPDDFRVDDAGTVRFARVAHLCLAGQHARYHPVSKITMWDWISTVQCNGTRSSGHVDSETIRVIKSLQKAQRSRSNLLHQICSLLADAAEHELANSESLSQSTFATADPSSIDFIRSYVDAVASPFPRWRIVAAAVLVLLAGGLLVNWTTRPAAKRPTAASIPNGFEKSVALPNHQDDHHGSIDRSPRSILAAIRPDRDCFDLECRSDGDELQIESQSNSGILQFPFTFPTDYGIAFRVHRLSGLGPISIGCQAGPHRVLTVIDETTPQGHWTGFRADNATAEQRVDQIASRAAMLSDGPLDVAITVAADQITLTCRNPRSNQIVQRDWSFDDFRVYSLTQEDAFYPCSLFIRFGKGVFRLGALELPSGSAPTPVFSMSQSSANRAARLLWRGGSVDIRSNGAQRNVTTLGGITAPAEVRSLSKSADAVRLAIGDDDLDWIGEMTQLRELDLRSSDVTDRGLQKLGTFESLQFLVLDGDRHSMNGLASLSPSPGLRSLMLERFQIDQSDADRFHPFAELTYLCLNGTNVDDETVGAMVGALPNLRHLCLKGTSIRGTCLDQVAMLGQLHQLMLARTGVDDADLRRLVPLRRLQQIDLERTAVTSNGRTWLASQFPNLEILQ